MAEADVVVQTLHPYWFDWITVAALVLGPVLALLTQRVLDHIREKQKRKTGLYFRLMSTRAQFLSNEHVQALNSVDIIFADNQTIRALWKKCLDHLATEQGGEEWTNTLTDLRVDLYQAIGNTLGFRYTTDYIKRGIYLPKFHNEAVEDQNKVLHGLATAVEDGMVKVRLIGD